MTEGRLIELEDQYEEIIHNTELNDRNMKEQLRDMRKSMRKYKGHLM